MDDGGGEVRVRTECLGGSCQRQIYLSRRCHAIVSPDALIVNLSGRETRRRDEDFRAVRRLGREKERRRIARGDTKSNADVPRGRRIACEMARPDRQRHVRRRGGRRQIFTARSERRPSGGGETARADEKETAGIPVRDEGSELQSARERNGDRCGRPRARRRRRSRAEKRRDVRNDEDGQSRF